MRRNGVSAGNGANGQPRRPLKNDSVPVCCAGYAIAIIVHRRNGVALGKPAMKVYVSASF